MEIKITGWGYENIRRFNKLQIDLMQNNKLPHVTLVMMRNGTGKTTTITLMRAILSGVASEWDAKTVRGFKPTHNNVSQGKFYIKIKFGNDLYYYNLILDYEQGKASYQTSRVDLSGGLESGHELPIQLKGVFNNEGFISRFIFDGEQAKKTLSSGSKEAELAITYLYQIDKLDGLIAKIEALVLRKQAESNSRGASSTSLNNNRTRMENKKRNYANLITRKDFITEEITRENNDWDELEAKRTGLIASDERLRQEQTQLNQEKTKNIHDLNLVLQTISKTIKEPFQIHQLFDERLKGLVDNMQTLKLPKTTAREFFRELSNSKDCICGRPIGSIEKEAILKRADNYLGEDDLSALNAIKDKLRNYQRSDSLDFALKQMIQLKDNIQNIDSALNRLVLQLDEEAMLEAESLAQQQTGIKQRVVDLDRELKVLLAPYGSPTTTEQNNIATAEKVYNEALENLLRATGTYEYTQKAYKLIEYIKGIRSVTLQKLKDSIVIKTNEKVERIITDEHITVEKIDGNLILKDRSGVSEGQTLAIAYSYICSLFEHSPYVFPFVIDSPAAAMDLEVRREVAFIIPSLFKQLIIFVTSGERAGFAEKLYNIDGVHYITVEGKEDEEQVLCTLGKDYFAAYQCEEEE